MAREPELSIKVKVDPQIKPTELKTSIERKVKQSGEKPQIDIDPNVDGIKKKVEDKLKNIKATASITPVVDTEKLKTDIQQQINGIGDIPKVTVGVNVDDFSDELSKRLKEELKTVNEKLSYYLKNLTTNTAGLNSVVEGLFPSRGISNAVQSELKSVQAELTAGLKGVKSKVKPFKETDLFQIGDTESTTTIRRVEKLVKNIRDQFANLDNFYDADEEKFLDGFNSEFEKFQNNASETVEKLSALKKNLGKDKFSNLLDNEDFDAESTTKALTPLISFLKKLSTTSIKTGEDYDNLYALFNNKNTNKLFDESNDHLTRMKTRVGDITAETKTAIEVTGELAKTLNKAIKDDNSGYLSDAEIKTYGAAFDEVLSNIATKQEEINTKKQRTVELENDLLTKTRSNREALKQELEEYKRLLKSFGVKGDEDEGKPKGKSKPKSKEPDKTPAQKPAEEPKVENQDALNNGIAKIQAIVFDINQEELQKSIDTIFAKVSAPIGFRPANDAIANIKQQLQEAFKNVVILDNSIAKDGEGNNQNVSPLTTSISGKVTITDADIIVDVKNPVSIPGTITVAPASVQVGNSDDLQKNANALSSVKQSLNKIFTSAEGYGTKIAEIGPSVQYVAQEVDNLSKSLENQITDLDLIAKKTDAYGTTANSITLNTKDVAVVGDPVNVPVKATLEKAAITVPKEAVDIKVKGVLAPEDVKQTEAAAPQKPTEVPGHVTLSADDVVAPTAPVNIPGKVTLKVEDVTPPKESVKIPGKVELKVSDITPPKTAVELEGKVFNVTVDDSAKGKKKNAKDDVKKPDIIDLKGKVELKDEDIKRPDPLKLNGSVKIKAADVKIDDVEISKKEFDIKGNLILKNTENIAKSTTGSESSVSGISTVIDHPTVETDNFEARLAALDKLDHQSKEYKDGLEEIIADLKSTNKEIDEAIDSEKKLNSVQEDRQKALDQIRAAIKKNSNNMDRARKNGSAGSDLYSKFNAKQTMYKALEGEVSSGSGVKDWAKTYFPAKVDDINNVTDALREMRDELTEDQIKLAQVSADKSIERSTNKAATAVANLKSQIHDYLETNKKIQNSELAQPFRELMNALNSENAPEKIGELQKQFAELRARSKELGFETESLIDKFEKLFGTHLSTMITMAALHKVREGLREIYQNVVQIDTAVTELRKVSEYAGKSLEEYMGRAAEQAQKLGVSISDYINSTADWKRLGYSDEDAENMATYSTLLRNVGDGIDDVNTSSSYLISTLQGFGLLAKDAENVVDQIDKVANTQPITAQAIGEILTRSAASMKAANNDLAETISLGTAAYAVIQNAETVGTTLKSVSMYLRAAKSELEDAGESADGCANSVSELRSELKSLTGVDIMIDNKSFKSTYQILKELSQVWDKLLDVTQANVTEMIGGKRNANAISAILNNFDVAESAMESAANSAGTAWEENSVWMDSIQGRLAQLDASFQVLSQDVLSSGLLKTGVSFLTSIVKLLDKIINLTGALPAGLGITAFVTQLGEPKMTGFMIVPSNTPGGDTEQACGAYYFNCCRAREYLAKPTNMVA